MDFSQFHELVAEEAANLTGRPKDAFYGDGYMSVVSGFYRDVQNLSIDIDRVRECAQCLVSVIERGDDRD